MAQQEEEQNRSEPATPFKLREAQKRGQVSKSMEVTSLILLSVGIGLSYGWGNAIVQRELDFGASVFSRAHRFDLTQEGAVDLFGFIVQHHMTTFWLAIAALMITAILANVLQTGPVLSGEPLRFNLGRLNPAANLKRMFSRRLLYETLKTVLKLSLFVGVAWLAMNALLPTLVGALDRDPRSLGRMLLALTQGLAFKLLLVVAVVALIDHFYTRWDFARTMRMSRREMREEVKRREGDPLIRAKLRELQREAARRAASLQRVPEADVLITNPTHLSVALRYDRERMVAPAVTAKAAGERALEMRRIARRAGVAIVEDRPLARALFRGVSIDQGIPEELYPAVAEVLARVIRSRHGDGPPAGAAQEPVR